MGAFPGDQVERTLLAWQGNPDRATLHRLVAARRVLAFVPGLVALIIAISALSAASFGVAASGVGVEGGVVTSVNPAGFGWRNGVREGQAVVAGPVDTGADGQSLTISGPQGPIALDEPHVTRQLRRTAIVAVIALLLAAVAVAGRAAVPGVSTVAAMLALPLAAPAMILQGDPVGSSVAAAAAFVVPVGWIITRLPWSRVRIGAAVLLVAAVIAWAIAQFTGADAFTTLDGIRSTAGLVATLAAAILLMVLPAWRGRRARAAGFGLRPLDVLVFGGLVGGAVVLLSVLHLPDLAVAGLLIAGLAVYPATRRRLTEGADRLVLGGIRETAAIEATERERVRVASELHDLSMQELSGVIRRLERLPDAAPERDALREVAQHLRDVATAMRPPMLDDFGLVPALGFLAERATRANLAVVVDVADSTGVTRGERLPPEIELEMYRICEEAVNNAVAHARASRIDVSGEVSASEVRLTIRDDGVGISDDAADRARHAGRLGLLSMRRRAATIGATLDVGGAPPSGGTSGTAIEVRWRR